jgi:hypothetical protein
MCPEGERKTDGVRDSRQRFPLYSSAAMRADEVKFAQQVL